MPATALEVTSKTSNRSTTTTAPPRIVIRIFGKVVQFLARFFHQRVQLKPRMSITAAAASRLLSTLLPATSLEIIDSFWVPRWSHSRGERPCPRFIVRRMTCGNHLLWKRKPLLLLRPRQRQRHCHPRSSPINSSNSNKHKLLNSSCSNNNNRYVYVASYSRRMGSLPLGVQVIWCSHLSQTNMHSYLFFLPPPF